MIVMLSWTTFLVNFIIILDVLCVYKFLGNMLIEFFNFNITYVNEEFYNFNDFNNDTSRGLSEVNNNVKLSRRKQRKVEYAFLQYKFRRNRIGTVRKIFESSNTAGDTDKKGFIEFWNNGKR